LGFIAILPSCPYVHLWLLSRKLESLKSSYITLNELNDRQLIKTKSKKSLTNDIDEDILPSACFLEIF
jgi:hypothetical protein